MKIQLSHFFNQAFVFVFPRIYATSRIELYMCSSSIWRCAYINLSKAVLAEAQNDGKALAMNDQPSPRVLPPTRAVTRNSNPEHEPAQKSLLVRFVSLLRSATPAKRQSSRPGKHCLSGSKTRPTNVGFDPSRKRNETRHDGETTDRSGSPNWCYPARPRHRNSEASGPT